MFQLIPGGFLKAVVDDTTPQLSGDLDGQSLYDILNMVNGTFLGTGEFGGLVVDLNTVDLSDTIDGYVLAFDTTTQTWRGVVSAAANQAGNDGEIQFNDSGSFGADSNLFWDDTNKRLGVGINTPYRKIHIYEHADHATLYIQTGAANKAAEVYFAQPDNDWSMGADSNGNFKFRDNIGAKNVLRINAGAPADALVILSSGHAGLGASPATSAKLELTSTTGALLLTRLTTAQRNALTAVNGMVIYNSSTNKFNGYENGAWVNLV